MTENVSGPSRVPGRLCHRRCLVKRSTDIGDRPKPFKQPGGSPATTIRGADAQASAREMIKRCSARQRDSVRVVRAAYCYLVDARTRKVKWHVRRSNANGWRTTTQENLSSRPRSPTANASTHRSSESRAVLLPMDGTLMEEAVADRSRSISLRHRLSPRCTRTRILLVKTRKSRTHAPMQTVPRSGDGAPGGKLNSVDTPYVGPARALGVAHAPGWRVPTNLDGKELWRLANGDADASAFAYGACVCRPGDRGMRTVRCWR